MSDPATNLLTQAQLGQPLRNSDSVSWQTWLAVGGSLLGAFMAILDIQITNSALKDIQGALNATLDEGSWISTAYLVAEIVTIPLTGYLSKVFSIRLYLLVNATLFLVFSVCCASAWSLGSMIVFRALQGFTGGVLIPIAFTIVLTQLPLSKRAIGQTGFALAATFAPAIGPTVGGWLTENYRWQFIFYVNVIPGILMLGAIWYGLQAQPLQLKLLKKGDWGGILAMMIGLGCLEVVLEEGNRQDWFGSALITRCAVVASAALTLFLWIELTRPDPFINLRLLRRRNFCLASIIFFASGMGLYGSVFIVPLYLTQIQGYNALQIGEVLAWVGLPQLFIAPLLPQLMRRFDVRVLIGVGVSLFGTSCLMNSTMTADTAGEQLIWSNIVRALGQPLIITPLSSVASAGIEPAQAGSASSLFNMMRNLGGSIGIALLSTLITRREQFHSLRIGESISLYNLQTQQRIEQLTQFFTTKGSDPVTAAQQALSAISNVVRRESYVMAYNDCFYSIGVILLLSGCLVFFIRKVKPSKDAAAH